MDVFGRLLVLLLGWSCLASGLCALLKDHLAGLAKEAEVARSRKTAQDTVSEHMQMLYTKYNSAGFSLKDGNTVRSFKSHLGTINNKQLYIFNLTSLAKSENVVSATLHYYIRDLQNSSRSCTRPRSCRHGPRRQSLIHVRIWSTSSKDNSIRTLGHFLINVSSGFRDLWQWKDITHVVNQAKHHDELLMGISIDFQGQQPRMKPLLDQSPYILVYANDSAIYEPESVVTILQRHKGSLVSGLHKLGLHNRNNSLPHRTKRSTNILLPLQNNELPGPEYPYEIPTWDETSPYDPIENKPTKRPRKKPRKKPGHKNPLLQFDEQTIKKARKKQWNEPRTCARRYLKVDFDDIGWSEWIISPKSFDAYYCSGSCPFPMAKSLKPSNHATIQGIVRAVGVVPGIPEPCCVPEKMSSLSILFLDEDKNVVLRVYPDMTVDSCACR